MPGSAPFARLNQRSLGILVQHSAVIFSGRVLSVESAPATTVQGTITVTFMVEVAIRGVTPGQFSARFFPDSPASIPVQPGQRLVVFLRRPNAAGITSVVEGPCGLFTRRGGDRVNLAPLSLCSPWSAASASGPIPEKESVRFRDLRPPAADNPADENMPIADFLKVLRRLANPAGTVEGNSGASVAVSPFSPSRDGPVLDQ